MIDRSDLSLSRATAPSRGLPRVSVVIIWPHAIDRLGEVLTKRVPQVNAGAVDGIVITLIQVGEIIAAQHPEIRFIAAPADASVAQMRRLGLHNATGDIVMLIDNLYDGDLVNAAFLLRTADGTHVGPSSDTTSADANHSTPPNGIHIAAGAE